MKCEKCGKNSSRAALFDYCASCSKNLCQVCMKLGCCGKTPAVSGMGEDGDAYISKTVLGGTQDTVGNTGGTDAGGQAPSSSDTGGSAVSGGCDSGGSDGRGGGGGSDGGGD